MSENLIEITASQRFHYCVSWMHCVGNHVSIPKQWPGSLSVYNFPCLHPWKPCFEISWFPEVNLSVQMCVPISFLETAHMSQYLRHSDLLLPHIRVCKVFPQIFVLLVGNGEYGLGSFSEALECSKLVTAWTYEIMLNLRISQEWLFSGLRHLHQQQKSTDILEDCTASIFRVKQ
jgi:hypothetical protein